MAGVQAQRQAMLVPAPTVCVVAAAASEEAIEAVRLATPLGAQDPPLWPFLPSHSLTTVAARNARKGKVEKKRETVVFSRVESGTGAKGSSSSPKWVRFFSSSFHCPCYTAMLNTGFFPSLDLPASASAQETAHWLSKNGFGQQVQVRLSGQCVFFGAVLSASP